MSGEHSDHRGSQASAPPSRSQLKLAAIDRDAGLMQVLSKRLLDRGWDYTIVASAITPEALVRMRLNALILDVTVLGPDCWPYLESVCSRLPSLAVIVCTGPSSVAQRVRGLRLGVDAWVTKPCHPEELISVVEATLRRHRRTELAVLDPPTVAGEVMIRHELHQAFVGAVSVELTSREFEILQLLAAADRVLRREEIYERVWGYAMAHGDRSVDVFVRKLRQKLRTASPGWDYIHTHFGVGYRFEPLARKSRDQGTVPLARKSRDQGTIPAPAAPAPEADRSQLVYTSALES